MMRLRRLDLTRFGHFTDQHVDLGPARPGRSDFHIIYGPNEAGKTTLMEAYLRLIYGFPMRDGYGFKHPLNTLQVGGLVEINGVATELVRLKRTANSLQDGHGDAISEAILQGCLGGIAQDDYRKLFCLDDATIEAGGDEITNSKGDIGRLLFAAAAGIGDLTGVLDLVAARAEGFYKKNASKTTFAGLKREIEALSGQIRTIDVSASLYQGLRTSVEAAKTALSAARLAKEAHDRRKARLAALIAAHEIAAPLRVAEDALLPIRHYPLTLDIDPESLVSLMSERIRLEAEQDLRTGAITQATADRDALVLRPDVMALRDEIGALESMRGRMEGAAADLPVRTAERADVLAAMRGKLVEIGLNPGDDPTRFVLRDPVLLGLERSLQACREADRQQTTAKDELRHAQETLRTSATELAKAKAAITVSPALDAVLIRFDGPRCVEENRNALQRISLASNTAAQHLRSLGRGGMVFATLPAASLTIREAEILAHDGLRSGQTVETLRNALSAAAEKLAKAQARLGVLTAATSLVTDDVATLRRAIRDARWREHRAALNQTTADHFADAMQSDDTAVALRQTQTREIAEYHQARIATSEAEAEHLAVKDRLETAKIACAALDATNASHLAILGLPAGMSAADLVDWLRQLDAARTAHDTLQAAHDTSLLARSTAEALRLALAALPDLQGDADLDTLFRLAMGQSDARKTQLAALQVADAAHTKDAAAASARQSGLDAAQIRCDEAQSGWQIEVRTALPADTPLASLPDALPSLRSLRELNETVSGLSRQIDGMARDQEAFVRRSTQLGARLGVTGDTPPLDVCLSARKALADAETALEEWTRLTRLLAEAETAHTAARSALGTQDAQIRHLAGAFAPGIPAGTLQDLRAAVAQGNAAINLRGIIEQDTAALVTRLGVTTRGAAEAALAAQPLQEAEAAFASLCGETEHLSKTIETAIEARTKAQEALDRVQGDADVAKCVAQQRTLEIEMQEGTLRYLEDRFAHLLAERAIRRYRDTHRGRMLVATEAAFHILTNGAYASLTTQAEGQSEALVAIQSASGGAKQAREMSKGTKFQLYLALRAAAYEQVAAGGTVVPFFCDDIFETFDEQRTAAACGLLGQIGKTGQSIYLTHHRHVVDIAQNLCGDDVRVHQLTG